MGLSTIAIKEAPTSYTTTGGTALTTAITKQTGDELILSFTSDTDLKTRRSMQLRRTGAQPDKSAPNGYSQIRYGVFIMDPKVLANLALTRNTAQTKLAFDIESTVAERLFLRDCQVQALMSAEFTAALTNDSFSA